VLACDYSVIAFLVYLISPVELHAVQYDAMMLHTNTALLQAYFFRIEDFHIKVSFKMFIKSFWGENEM